jgi:hypothetical protein
MGKSGIKKQRKKSVVSRIQQPGCEGGSFGGWDATVNAGHPTFAQFCLGKGMAASEGPTPWLRSANPDGAAPMKLC